MYLIEQRNKVSIGDEIEIMIPGKGFITQKIVMITDTDGVAIESTPHPKMRYYLQMSVPVKPMDILRKQDKI